MDNSHPISASTDQPLIPTSASHPTNQYSKRAAIGLGITQMVIGVLCIVFMSVEIAVCYETGRCLGTSYSGIGIWCGIIFFISGLIGFLSGKQTIRRGIIISFMVMSIVSASFTAFLFTLSVINAIFTDYRFHNSINLLPVNTIISMSSMMAIMSVVEAVVGIISAALCCRVICCASQVHSLQMYDPNTQTVSFVSVQSTS